VNRLPLGRLFADGLGRKERIEYSCDEVLGNPAFRILDFDLPRGDRQFYPIAIDLVAMSEQACNFHWRRF